MITILKTDHPRVVGFKMSGKLKDEDYSAFVPQADKIVADAHGKVRVLVQFEDFRGWDLHGAWDDFKFGVKHYSDTERIAVVGDRKWEEWLARMWKPFTVSEVRFYDTDRADEAWAWLHEGL